MQYFDGFFPEEDGHAADARGQRFDVTRERRRVARGAVREEAQGEARAPELGRDARAEAGDGGLDLGREERRR